MVCVSYSPKVMIFNWLKTLANVRWTQRLRTVPRGNGEGSWCMTCLCGLHNPSYSFTELYFSLQPTEVCSVGVQAADWGCLVGCTGKVSLSCCGQEVTSCLFSPVTTLLVGGLTSVQGKKNNFPSTLLSSQQGPQFKKDINKRKTNNLIISMHILHVHGDTLLIILNRWFRRLASIVFSTKNNGVLKEWQHSKKTCHQGQQKEGDNGWTGK